ncbi:sigma-70 family RNA polymerase sigma factor [Pectinatus sottacetonis]|uniref:sigma-70 family RNA polymerase sigma factor n=1 Tax=Pectinatus sottacetonis TaxID=1002795 RepID=UPI0018C6B3DB|nr:sigma-70 family RNA polymerase sigma factor [Pectinatus sottacetonis]
MYKKSSNELNFSKIFKDYQGLLHKAASQNHLRPIYEEAYACASVSLYEALQNYDKNRKIPFPGYAKAKIYSDLRTLFKKYRRNWQRETPVNTNANSTEAKYILHHNAYFIENNIINKTILINALQQLSTQQQKIIKYTIIVGYTQKETARLLNISQQAVAANKKHALAILKKLLS